MEWTTQKLNHSWLYGTKYVFRSNHYAIWAGRENGKLYYDCYRGHVWLGKADNPEDARSICKADKEARDARTNTEQRSEVADR